MTEALRLVGIEKWVLQGEEQFPILHNIHLSVEAGEYIAIMGASGSGKSTLLNLMGLLDRPSGGEFHFFGRETSTMPEDDSAVLRARSIGFIFQSFNLLPYLTAEQNVTLPMGYIGLPDAETRAKVLLSQVKLDHRLHHYPITLSGGERQRVAIARALANQPKLILADEPTGALDSKTGMQVMDLISQMNHGGTTVVVVTHDEKIARRAKRIVHMKDGTID